MIEQPAPASSSSSSRIAVLTSRISSSCVGVVIVADRGPDQLRRNRAELDRPRGHALRHLPQRGVLQRSPLDLVDAARHHAALHHLEDDVALHGAAVALAHALVVAARQALEAPGRVLKPAHAADVGVEPRVAVGDDVEAGALLIAKVGRRPRRCTARGSARPPARPGRGACARFSVYQTGRGSDPVMVVGSVNSFVAFSIGKNYIVF